MISQVNNHGFLTETLWSWPSGTAWPVCSRGSSSSPTWATCPPTWAYLSTRSPRADRPWPSLCIPSPSLRCPSPRCGLFFSSSCWSHLVWTARFDNNLMYHSITVIHFYIFFTNICWNPSLFTKSMLNQFNYLKNRTES